MDTDDSLMSTQNLILQYQQAFIEHGDVPAGVLWPRGRQHLRFDALTKHFPRDGFSVLDYGCGLGHLKDYLDERYSCYQYYGADLVPEFIKALSEKHPNVNTSLVHSYEDISISVDHVVISGTFNIIADGNRASYIEKVKAALLHLFSLTRVSLAVNFMTDRVDYIQPHALHMNAGDIVSFARSHLSPRLILDESYMPYEFTLVVLKDDQIIRPDNIYKVC